MAARESQGRKTDKFRPARDFRSVTEWRSESKALSVLNEPGWPDASVTLAAVRLGAIIC